MFTVKTAAMAAAAAAALGLAGCAETATVTTDTGTSTTSSDTAAPEAAEPATYSPSVNDFEVKLKVTDKQCFGSAGCNVTVEPKVTKLSAEVPSEGSIDLTYKISGDDSGPVIGTTTLDLSDGTYSVDEVWLSTSSSGVTPKAKVTEIEYTDW